MPVDEVVSLWSRFSEVLMLEDRQLFQRMVSDLNVEALEGLGLGIRDFELLAMTLIFQQWQMIVGLLDTVEKLEEKRSRS